MERDARLQGLSSEHHRALVLARWLVRARDGWSAGDAARLELRFETELEPHFRVEEEVLVPALRAAGAGALVSRLERDHAELRALTRAACAGDGDAAFTMGTRLQRHVRFEEQELLPRCEADLPDAVLDEVRRRAPHRR